MELAQLAWAFSGLRLPGELLAKPPEVDDHRSPDWDRVRHAHILLHPTCEACGNPNNPEVHHLWPYHLFPQWELAEWNLYTLCRVHHLIFGHLMDWQAYNPQVVHMVREYRRRLDTRPHEPMPTLTAHRAELIVWGHLT
jgi:5-methylcytosine-specific restriction enzyme A